MINTDFVFSHCKITMKMWPGEIFYAIPCEDRGFVDERGSFRFEEDDVN